jgi:hypothetical protein
MIATAVLLMFLLLLVPVRTLDRPENKVVLEKRRTYHACCPTYWRQLHRLPYHQTYRDHHHPTYGLQRRRPHHQGDSLRDRVHLQQRHLVEHHLAERREDHLGYRTHVAVAHTDHGVEHHVEVRHRATDFVEGKANAVHAHRRGLQLDCALRVGCSHYLEGERTRVDRVVDRATIIQLVSMQPRTGRSSSEKLPAEEVDTGFHHIADADHGHTLVKEEEEQVSHHTDCQGCIRNLIVAGHTLLLRRLHNNLDWTWRRACVFGCSAKLYWRDSAVV